MGRKPIVDDRKNKPIITYVSEEDLNKIDGYLKETRDCSKAWFIRRLVLDYIDGKVVPKESALSFEGIDKKDAALLRSVLKDKEKVSYLMQIIKDSKFLQGESNVDAHKMG